MSQVEFENDQPSGYASVSRGAVRSAGAQSEGRSAMSRLIIRIGFASDEKGAQRVLLGVAAIALCVTAYFAYQLLFAHKAQIPPTMPAFIPH